MRTSNGSGRFCARRWWETASALCMLYAAGAAAAPAQTFTTLYSFCSQSTCTDGYDPASALVQGTDGSLYGATYGGGSSGDGTVFQITLGGKLTTLYSFCSQSGCADGGGPDGLLVQAADGSFYGTTGYGGVNACTGIGCGTVFKITSSGMLTTLHSFDGTDGETPLGLVAGSDGTFYGTTSGGGAYSHGTVFKITANGALTTLYSFCSIEPCSAGADPGAPLMRGIDGNFYGTTLQGGAGNNCQYAEGGCGTAFRISPDGTHVTLHSFCLQTRCLDGFEPSAALVQGRDGNFYGTTLAGGTNSCVVGGVNYGCGTVFKMGPSGGIKTLYSFCSESSCSDGSAPQGALVQGTDGNFYGTTDLHGVGVAGTLFEIMPSGSLATLYSFCSQTGCTDGEEPIAGLVQDTGGTFYGTTSLGGTSNACEFGCGTVFSFSTGLAEFVEPEPASGRVGARIKVLGTALRGATRVTFNGIPATFTVSSSSLITTTVPAAATTGPLSVTTPHGTIESKVLFRVSP